MVATDTRRSIKKQSKTKKKVSIKSLEKKLKAKLYPLIKKRDGNTCISCGRTGLTGMNWHAGHYAKAELCNMIWRYAPINIHSQCGRCNLWLRGNTVEYRKKLTEKVGQELVREIEENYNKPLSMAFDSRVYLESLIENINLIIIKSWASS